MTANSVWIVLSASQVTDKIRDLIHSGDLAEVNRLTYSLDSFLQKIKSFAQSKGGKVYLSLYDKQIVELPLSAAEELPNIIESYRADFHEKLAVGVGLSLLEASQASEYSEYSGDIELFEPERHRMLKADESDATIFELPPNLLDPLTPDRDLEEPDPESRKPAVLPDPQSALQMEQEYITAVAQSMQPPQAEQQGQPGQEPQDLMEALNGGPVAGRQPGPNTSPAKEEKPQEEGDAAPEQLAEDVEAAENQAEEAGNQKLGQLLHQVKSQLPQLMQLHDTNPEAFKQSMAVISKLIGMARGKQRVSKSMIEDCEELAKAFNLRRKSKFPVGSTIKGRRKVIVDGKAVWRSVKSGLTRDAKGSAISVKAHNKESESESEPKE